METGEDEGDDPLGHMTGDLDLNDNNHIITHRVMDCTEHIQTRKPAHDDLIKMSGIPGSANHVCSRSSTVSDNTQQVPGLLYSPEDTLNNDFFYDDEFAVPFDATLGGLEGDAMDSMELNRLLRMSAAEDDDDNRRWRTKMSASKSDSCLYQGDLYQAELDFSDCSDPVRSSSERDLLTSSDMSDFKAEPLFSPPPPGEYGDSCGGLQTESLCNEELAGSLVKDEDRYAFDWTANKDQYMISFDRSPTKISTDNLYREPPPKRRVRGMVRSRQMTGSRDMSTSREMCSSREMSISREVRTQIARDTMRQMTCWGQRSSGSSGGPGSSGHGSSTSGPYSSQPSSRGPSSVCPSSSEMGSASSLPSSPACVVSLGNTSSRAGSTDTSSSSTMTTWKLLRHHKGRGKLPDGMTTWKHVRDSHLVNSVTRSKSMPELQSSTRLDSALHREKSPAGAGEDGRPKRYSASLLEMYRQLKAGQGVLQAYCDPPIVETTPSHHQFEIDTWSMSPASSHQMSPTEGTTPAITDSSMIRWNTQSDLCTEPGAATYRDDSGKLKTGPVFNKCKSDRLNDNGSEKCPPSVTDCGVQTSIDKPDICAKPSVKKTQNNKSLQTSMELLTGAHIRIHRRQHRGYPAGLGTMRPHSMGSIHTNRQSLEEDRFTVQLSRQGKERMTRSLFFNSTVLPDLSFLSKQMSCSISNLTQTLHQLPDKARGEARTPHKPVVIPGRATQPSNTHPAKSAPVKCDPVTYRPKKPPRQRRPLSACLGHSRDSSPVLLGLKHRSRSTDSASSFCSSSSSGIDPGSYESHKSGHYFMEHHSRRDNNHRYLLNHDGKMLVAKDRPGTHYNHGNNIHGNSKECGWLAGEMRTAKVCNICRAHYQSEGEEDSTMAVSHPSYRKSSTEEGFSSWTSCDCSRISNLCRAAPCTCVDCTPCMCLYQEVCAVQMTGCGDCAPVCATARCRHHHLHHRRLCHSSKPLKSCLVKRRQGNHGNQKMRAFKHRSWSDPSDGLVLKYSQEGQIRYQLVTHDKECRRRQPLAELEITEHSSETRKQPDGSKKVTEKQKPKPPCCLDYLPGDEAVDHGKDANTAKVKVIKGIALSEKKQVAPSNSPQEIPVPPCTCGTTHAVLHSSSDSGEGSRRCSSDIYRSKKSVSFSEEVSYHSPYNTPDQSPKKHPAIHSNDTGTGVVIRHPLGRHLSPKKRPLSLPPDFRLIVPIPASQTIPECDTPPTDFVVSPPSSIIDAPSMDDSNVKILHMKDLVHDVVKATQILIKHFSDTREIQKQAELSSSSESSEVGQIVLQYLCPAVYAVIQDGLKTHVRSLFGKVKNTPWKVVEDSMESAVTSRVVRELVHDLKSLDFLSTAWLKFNAFIFGLLNNKTLDIWLSQLQSNSQVIQKHYDSESFLCLATTTDGLSVFLDLITVIQPLTNMPFRLEYNFEYRLLEGRQQQQLSEQILNKHLSRSSESQVDNEQWLLQQKQAARLKVLSVSGDTSPIRGEISPVLGTEGQPQGVLHHSAPTAYHEQQVALYSPNKARWQSLYHKVQQLKTSDIALHTKTLVTESIKSLKDSATFNTTLKISKDALQNLGQDLVLAAVGYSSPVKSLPKVPGLTDSGDSTGTKHSNSSSTSTIGENTLSCNTPPRKALSVLENNELLISDNEEDEKSESFIQRVSQRLIGYNSPQKAYKQGVTEYQFDNKAKTRPNSLASSKSLDGLSKTAQHRFSKSKIPVRSESLTQRESLFDEDGMPRCTSLDESIEFQIPSRTESFDSPTTPPGDSGHKSTESKPRSGKLSKKLGSSLRRSWGSFGPKLVNFMDHLLLDESKGKGGKKKKKSVSPTVASGTSSSSMSSGSSSPPSVLQPAASPPSVHKPAARPPLTRSTTVGPCESSTSPTGLLHIQERLQSEERALIDINTEAAVAPSGDGGRVAPSGDGRKVKLSIEAHEHNWFVQALCHHVAMQDRQLSYDKGTVFAVIKQVDSDWLLCRHGDKEGLVHTACVRKA